jgi:hypothetical protein
LDAEEIARQVKVAPATVYRDLKAIRATIAVKLEAASLWPIKRHVLLQEELMREAWLIYHRPKEKRTIVAGKDMHEVEIDDSFRKLLALHRLHRISSDLAKLAFPQAQETHQEPLHGADPVKILVRIIDELPFEQKEKVISAVRSEYVKAAPRTP